LLPAPVEFLLASGGATAAGESFGVCADSDMAPCL